MFRAILIDDEDASKDYLAELLREHQDVNVIGRAGNIQEGALLLEKEKPELVFLDVEMPGGTGFDLLAKMGKWSFDVIFTTGFSRYAIQAIRFSALDYLLKPVQPDELAVAMGRFRERHVGTGDRSQIQQQFLDNIQQAEETAMKLTLTSGDKSYFIAPSEVMYCTADGNYTELHLKDGRRFMSARTLKEYEEMLRDLGFLRVHRSGLVNRAEVSHLSDHHVVLKNGIEVELSRRKKQDVKRQLAN